MALNLGNLFFQLGADTSGLRKATRASAKFAEQTNRHYRRAGKSAGKFAKDTTSSFKRASGAAQSFKNVLVGVVSVVALRRVVLLTDSYNRLQERIKTATSATGDYNRVSSELFRIANKNGTELATIVPLFQNLARAAPQLGATRQEVLTLTDIVGQLGVIGGSSAEQLKYGLLQFSQGLAAGVFRAEEFNSILENIPEIADRIAKGMGTNTGHLRKQVLLGKVLSSEVFDALVKQTAKITEEFELINPTINRTAVALYNSFAKFLGQVDKMTGAATAIASVLQSSADTLSQDFTRELENTIEAAKLVEQSLAAWGYLINRAFVELTSFDEVANSLDSVGDVFKATALAMLELPVNLRAVYHIVKEEVTQLMASSEQLANNVASAFKLTWQAVKQFGDEAISAIVLTWAKGVDSMINYFADVLQSIMPILDTPLNGLFKGMMSGVTDASKALRSLAIAENLARVEAEATAEANKAVVQSIHDEVAANDAAVDAFNAASRNRIDAALATRDATIQQWETAKAARQDERDGKRQAAADDKVANAKKLAATTKLEADLKAIRIAANKQKAADAAAELVKTQLRPKLEALRASLLTERELEIEHYEASKLLLEESMTAKLEAQDSELATLLTFHELKERLEAEHQGRLDHIDSKGQDKRRKHKETVAINGVKFDVNANTATVDGQLSMHKDLLSDASQHSKAAFAVAKALSLAQATVAAPEAIISSYAFGAKLGGPVGGTIFAALAAAATAIQLSSIASATFTGKATGGDVFAGGMYKVNEQGPELLSVGGNDFLMMGGQGGHITPNNKLSSSSKPVVVNVYPIEGEQANVQSREDSDGTQIDIIIEKIEQKIADGIGQGGSPVSDTLEGQYGLNRVAGALS